MRGMCGGTDIFGMGNPSPTAIVLFLFVGEAFRLPLFDLRYCFGRSPSYTGNTEPVCISIHVQIKIINFSFTY